MKLQTFSVLAGSLWVGEGLAHVSASHAVTHAAEHVALGSVLVLLLAPTLLGLKPLLSRIRSHLLRTDRQA